MTDFQPTGIQLHLITGNRCMFYQEQPELVEKICKDMDGHIFSRASLIIEGKEDVSAFPGSALIGITVLTDPLPEFFYERERLSGTVITQLSPERFQLRRINDLAKVEGERSAVLSQIEFVSGERLYLEFSEVAVSGFAERKALNNLFLNPSLSCRRLEGGFTIWNTAHMVSWSHYPKMEVPMNAWQADSIANTTLVEPRFLKSGIDAQTSALNGLPVLNRSASHEEEMRRLS
jgi:hypothetical protein